MSKILHSLLLGAVIAAAGAARAQEATDAETAAPETAQTETAAPDPTADLVPGQPVIEVGQPYIAEKSGDWSLQCLKTEEAADPCQLYQLLTDEDGNSIAEISMFPLPPGRQFAAGATIVVPLETLLTEQLTLSVDGTATRRYPFTFCNQGGCVARVGFNEQEVAQFKRGNQANLRLVPALAPDQEVNLTISLIGFTAGFDNTVSGQ